MLDPWMWRREAEARREGRWIGRRCGKCGIVERSGEARRLWDLDLCGRSPGLGLELHGLGSSRLRFLLLSTDELYVLVVAALGLVEEKVSLK
jgi:hypothetical protein